MGDKPQLTTADVTFDLCTLHAARNLVAAEMDTDRSLMDLYIGIAAQWISLADTLKEM